MEAKLSMSIGGSSGSGLDSSLASMLDASSIFPKESPPCRPICSFEAAEKSIEKAIDEAKCLHRTIGTRAPRLMTIYYDRANRSIEAAQWDDEELREWDGTDVGRPSNDAHVDLEWDNADLGLDSLQHMGDRHRKSVGQHLSLNIGDAFELEPAEAPHSAGFRIGLVELRAAAFEVNEFCLPAEWIAARAGQLNDRSTSDGGQVPRGRPFASHAEDGNENLLSSTTNDVAANEHQCSFCGYSFRSSATLKTHSDKCLPAANCLGLEPKSDPLEYACRGCAEACDTRSEWRLHTRDCRAYQQLVNHDICTICGRAFKNRHLLRKHMNVHLKGTAFFIPSLL